MGARKAASFTATTTATCFLRAAVGQVPGAAWPKVRIILRGYPSAGNARLRLIFWRAGQVAIPLRSLSRIRNNSVGLAAHAVVSVSLKLFYRRRFP